MKRKALWAICAVKWSNRIKTSKSGNALRVFLILPFFHVDVMFDVTWQKKMNNIKYLCVIQ